MGKNEYSVRIIVCGKYLVAVTGLPLFVYMRAEEGNKNYNWETRKNGDIVRLGNKKAGKIIS